MPVHHAQFPPATSRQLAAGAAANKTLAEGNEPSKEKQALTKFVMMVVS